MKIRCDLHINGEERKLILVPNINESFERVGHSDFHISRETWPWRRLTALRRPASLRASASPAANGMPWPEGPVFALRNIVRPANSA